MGRIKFERPNVLVVRRGNKNIEERKSHVQSSIDDQQPKYERSDKIINETMIDYNYSFCRQYMIHFKNERMRHGKTISQNVTDHRFS